MLTTLTHDALAQLSAPKLRRRVRQAKEDIHEAALRAAYGRPDFPTSRTALEQAVFRYQDAAAALDRLQRTEAHC